MEPVLFCSHGGGPSFFLTESSPTGILHGMDSRSECCAHFKSCMGRLYEGRARPKAILVISAHWEGEGGAVEVLSAEKLLYDYYNFPEHTYSLSYDCPTVAPELMDKVQQLVSRGGFTCRKNCDRGFDHGVFIPLKLLVPQAEIPVLQVSLLASFDAAQHIALGEALAPLRREGVLIVGSGQATHNLQRLRGPQTDVAWAHAFQSWLDETVTGDIGKEERRRLLERWDEEAPHGRVAHPREEHLLPLLAAAGAAGLEVGAEKMWGGWAAGHLSLASYAWRAGTGSSSSSSSSS